MNTVILIKYGELTTKKSNRKFFINTLYNNILKKLKDLDVIISKDMSRMYIEYDSINENLVLKRIGEIFGIHAYEIAYKVETDKDNILDTIKEVSKSLEEKGYNPINQIVGYLLSGDPAYIPRLNDARNLIRQHERDEIIEELVRSYLKNNGETK